MQCGTEGFIAPEVSETGYHRGFYSDIFSAGVVLFMLIKASPPWEEATA